MRHRREVYERLQAVSTRAAPGDGARREAGNRQVARQDKRSCDRETRPSHDGQQCARDVVSRQESLSCDRQIGHRNERLTSPKLTVPRQNSNSDPKQTGSGYEVYRPDSHNKQIVNHSCDRNVIPTSECYSDDKQIVKRQNSHQALVQTVPRQQSVSSSRSVLSRQDSCVGQKQPGSRHESQSCGRGTQKLSRNQNPTDCIPVQGQRLSRRSLFDNAVQTKTVGNVAGAHKPAPGCQIEEPRPASTAESATKPAQAAQLGECRKQLQKAVSNATPKESLKSSQQCHSTSNVNTSGLSQCARDGASTATGDRYRPRQRYCSAGTIERPETSQTLAKNTTRQQQAASTRTAASDGLKPSYRAPVTATAGRSAVVDFCVNRNPRLARRASTGAPISDSLTLDQRFHPGSLYKEQSSVDAKPDGLSRSYRERFSSAPRENFSSSDRDVLFGSSRSLSHGRQCDTAMNSLNHNMGRRDIIAAFGARQNGSEGFSCKRPVNINGQNFSHGMSSAQNHCKIPVIGNQIQSLRQETEDLYVPGEPSIQPFMNRVHPAYGYINSSAPVTHRTFNMGTAPRGVQPNFSDYIPNDLRFVPSAAEQFEIDQCRHRLHVADPRHHHFSPARGSQNFDLGLQSMHMIKSNQRTFCESFQGGAGHTVQGTRWVEHNTWTNLDRGMHGIANSSDVPTPMFQSLAPFHHTPEPMLGSIANSFSGYNNSSSTADCFSQGPQCDLRLPGRDGMGMRPLVRPVESPGLSSYHVGGRMALPPPPMPPRKLLFKPIQSLDKDAEMGISNVNQVSRNKPCTNREYQHPEDSQSNKFKCAENLRQTFENTSKARSGSTETEGRTTSIGNQFTSRSSSVVTKGQQNSTVMPQSQTLQRQTLKQNRPSQTPIYRPWETAAHNSGRRVTRRQLDFNKPSSTDKRKANTEITGKADHKGAEAALKDIGKVGVDETRKCLKPKITVSEADSSTSDQNFKLRASKQGMAKDNENLSSDHTRENENTGEVNAETISRKHDMKDTGEAIENNNPDVDKENNKHSKSWVVKKSFAPCGKENPGSLRHKKETKESERHGSGKNKRSKPELKRDHKSLHKLKSSSTQNKKSRSPKVTRVSGNYLKPPKSKQFSSFLGSSATTDTFVKKLVALELKHQKLLSKRSKCLKPAIDTRSSCLSKVTCPTINKALNGLSEIARPKLSLRANIENKILKKLEGSLKKYDEQHRKKKRRTVKQVCEEDKEDRGMKTDSKATSCEKHQIGEQFFKLGRSTEKRQRTKSEESQRKVYETPECTKKGISDESRRNSQLKPGKSLEPLGNARSVNNETSNNSVSISERQTIKLPLKLRHKIPKDVTIKNCSVTLKDDCERLMKTKSNGIHEKKAKESQPQCLQKGGDSVKTASASKVDDSEVTDPTTVHSHEKQSAQENNAEMASCRRKLEINRKMRTVSRGKYVLATPTTFVIKPKKSNEVKLPATTKDDERFQQACAAAKQHLQSRTHATKTDQSDNSRSTKENSSAKKLEAKAATLQTECRNMHGFSRKIDSLNVKRRSKSVGEICDSSDRKKGKLSSKNVKEDSSSLLMSKGESNGVGTRIATSGGMDKCTVPSSVTDEINNTPLPSSAVSRSSTSGAGRTSQMTNTGVGKTSANSIDENNNKTAHNLIKDKVHKGQEPQMKTSKTRLIRESLFSSMSSNTDSDDRDGKEKHEKKQNLTNSAADSDNSYGCFNSVLDRNLAASPPAGQSLCEQRDVLDTYRQYLKAKVDLSRTDRRPVGPVVPPIMISPSRMSRLSPSQMSRLGSSRMPRLSPSWMSQPQSSPRFVPSPTLSHCSSKVPNINESKGKTHKSFSVGTNASLQDKNLVLGSRKGALPHDSSYCSCSLRNGRLGTSEVDSTEQYDNNGLAADERLTAIPLGTMCEGDDDVFEDDLSVDLDFTDDCIDTGRGGDCVDLDQYAEELAHGSRNVFDDALADLMDDKTFSFENEENVADRFELKDTDDSVGPKCFDDSTQEDKSTDGYTSPTAYQVRIRSERRKRYQKHFPVPLPKAKSDKNFNSERGLYEDAKEFLADFDASKKRSSSKNKFKMVDETTNKVNSMSGRNEITDQKENGSVTESSIVNKSENNVKTADNLEQVETLVAKKRKIDQEIVKCPKIVKCKKLRSIDITKNVKVEEKVDQIERKGNDHDETQISKAHSLDIKQHNVKGTKKRPINDEIQRTPIRKKKLEDVGERIDDNNLEKIPLLRIKTAKSGLKIVKRGKCERENRSGHFNAVTKRLKMYEKEAVKREVTVREASEEDKKYKCRECQQGYTDELRLRLHFGQSHKTLCFTCNNKFSTVEARRKHVKKHHKKVDTKIFCQLCSLWFCNKSSYMKHLKSYRHRTNEADEVPKPKTAVKKTKGTNMNLNKGTKTKPDINNNHFKSHTTAPSEKEAVEKTEDKQVERLSQSSVKSEKSDGEKRDKKYCEKCKKSYSKFSSHLKTAKHRGVEKEKPVKQETTVKRKYTARKKVPAKAQSPEQSNPIIELTNPQPSVEVNLPPIPCNPILLIKNVANQSGRLDFPNQPGRLDFSNQPGRPDPSQSKLLQCNETMDLTDDVCVIEMIDSPRTEQNSEDNVSWKQDESSDVCVIETLQPTRNLSNVAKLKKINIEGYYREMIRGRPRVDSCEDQEYSDRVLRQDHVVVVVSSGSELSSPFSQH